LDDEDRDKDMEKTRIGIRIGTRIEELETLENTPSFRLAGPPASFLRRIIQDGNLRMNIEHSTLNIEV
jgi:hypothetical protein